MEIIPLQAVKRSTALAGINKVGGRRMGKQATIRDVAKRAGVSLATVSRVLNDSDYPVRTELRQKVKAAVEELDYVPNAAARSLRRDTGRDIGLVIPNVSNPFYLQTMLGINDVLSKNDCSMILCNTLRDVDQERNCLRQLYERHTRGVILSSVDESGDVVMEYSQKGMRFVLLDQKLTGAESTGINFDSRAGARMAVEHLISMGHRRIAFATMPMTRWTRAEMHRGYRDALLDAALPYDASLIYEWSPSTWDANSDLELETGQYIAELLLGDRCPATAVLCVNDMVAIGMIKVFLKHGVRVPEDISVVGFDDIPFAGAFVPALTTVHQPAQETGRLAAMMILNALSSDDGELTVSMNLTPRLVIRDTVAPPPAET